MLGLEEKWADKSQKLSPGDPEAEMHQKTAEKKKVIKSQAKHQRSQRKIETRLHKAQTASSGVGGPDPAHPIRINGLRQEQLQAVQLKDRGRTPEKRVQTGPGLPVQRSLHNGCVSFL